MLVKFLIIATTEAEGDVALDVLWRTDTEHFQELQRLLRRRRQDIDTILRIAKTRRDEFRRAEAQVRSTETALVEERDRIDANLANLLELDQELSDMKKRARRITAESARIVDLSDKNSLSELNARPDIPLLEVVRSEAPEISEELLKSLGDTDDIQEKVTTDLGPLIRKALHPK